MTTPLTRSLGSRPGVQVNFPLDNTEGLGVTNTSTAFATLGLFTRGRTDKAFLVSKDNFNRYLGKGQSPNINPAHEMYVQIYEAFQNGADQAVIARYERSDAQLDFMVATDNADASAVWTTASALPGSYLLGVKHNERINEGVTISINAKATYDTDFVTPIASKTVTVTISDVNSNKILHSITGSLDPDAVDPYNKSLYLPNVASTQTNDLVEITVFADSSVATTSGFYGKDGSGANKVASTALAYYSPGVASLTDTEINDAVARLRNNDLNHRYFVTCGEQNETAILGLATNSKEMNRPLIIDVPGSLDVTAALAWINNLIGAIETMYVSAYWAPLKSTDPVNGGKAIIGTSGIQVGMRCARNAQLDANGVPPMNFPIAGKNYPLTRTGVIQLVFPTDSELDLLADNTINPVIFQQYNTGSNYVFTDSLTCARTDSARKLINVSEMSSQIDEWVALSAQECLQLPMQSAIKRLTNFEKSLFEGLVSASWLTPSADLGGKAYTATVAADVNRPFDKIYTAYSLHFDGTARAIEVQQTISK